MSISAGARAPRILYLLSHPIQYQAPLLRYLARSGTLDVHTVYIRDLSMNAYHDKDFGQAVQWDVPLTDGYSHQFLPGIGRTDRIARFTPILRGLAAAAENFRPDAVWVHGYDHVNGVRLLSWAKRRRVRTMVRAEVEWSDAKGGRTARAAKGVALRTGFPLIDTFLAIGQRNRQFYRDHGVPGSKIIDAPYAVDNARFAAARDQGGPDDLSRAHGLPLGRPTFLFAGKLIDRKRPMDPVHALAKLRDAHGLQANLVIVGSGELEPQLRELTAKLGLEDSVAMAGFLNQQDIAFAYAQCSALLLTSDRERWGLVANEAMAAGAPVIAYRSVGCADDLVQHGVSGLVVDTGDIDGLAGALAELSSPVRRNQLAGGAVERIEAFSFAAIESGLRQATERAGE